jgi:hypothetical protein
MNSVITQASDHSRVLANDFFPWTAQKVLDGKTVIVFIPRTISGSTRLLSTIIGAYLEQ